MYLRSDSVIKFLWYVYFGLYMLSTMRFKIKLYFLKKKSPKLADDYAYEKLRQIARHVIKKSNTKVIVKGLENLPEEPCVLVGNHQGIFDAFLLFACINSKLGFIAKQEILKVPLVGSWMKESKTIFIDRENPRQMVSSINAGIDNIKLGYSMVIFPEGTRSLSSEMGEFKKGSMKLATKIGVPIVPITIDGTYKVLETGNRVRGNTNHLVIHPPIYTKDLSKEEQQELTDKIYSIIKDELKEISKNK
jgi:1-acyl-sn-glycerol-3-phosphate acyltransferase